MAIENIIPKAVLQQELLGALTEVKRGRVEDSDLIGCEVISAVRISRVWELPIEKGKIGELTGNTLHIKFSPKEKAQVLYEVAFGQEIAWASCEDIIRCLG